MVYFLLTILIDLSFTTLVICKACGKDLLTANNANTQSRTDLKAKSIPGGIKLVNHGGLSVAAQSSTFPYSGNRGDQEDFCHILINYYQQLSRLTVGNLFLDRPYAGTGEQLTLEQVILQALEINQLVQELSRGNSLISSFLVHKPALFSSNSRLARHFNSIHSDTDRHIQMLQEVAQTATQDIQAHQQAIAENNRILSEYIGTMGKTLSACKKETVFFIAMVSEYFILE